MTYERTVAAAVAETKSKFALAEALAEDIPPRRNGPSEDATVSEYLAQARAEILRAGGETRSVKTLNTYRLTALWVYSNVEANYRWLPGVAFSAHSEAFAVGMSFDEFAANPQTARQIREATGRAPYGQRHEPDVAIAAWSPEQKAEAARELLSQPEIAAQVEDVITDYVASDSTRTAHVISKRRNAEPLPEYVAPRPEDRPKRDYDAYVESAVNSLSVALAAESSGNWTPSERSEALLYFLTQVLGERRAPTGAEADLVNDKLESLFDDVEAYANSEAG